MSDQIITAVTNQLHAVIDPYTNSKMTAGRALKTVQVDDSAVRISLVKGYPVASVTDELSNLIKQGISDLDLGGRDIDVSIKQEIIAH